MKKFIPTIFALAVTISTTSLFLGCGGVAEDPDAAKKEKENQQAPEAMPEKPVKGGKDLPSDGFEAPGSKPSK